MGKFFYFFSIVLIVISASCKDTFEKDLVNQAGTDKITALHESAKANVSDPEKAMGYAKEMLRISRELNSQKGIGDAYNIMGAVNRSQNNYVNALKHYLKSAEAFEISRDTSGLAKVYNNIGNIYRDITKYNNALRFYQKSLTAKTLLRDKVGMGVTNRNIAFVYQLMEDYERAKDSYWTSLYIWKILGEKERMAQLYNDLGIVYDLMLDKGPKTDYYVQQSIIYNLHLNSLELNQKIDNQKGIGWAYNNIATSLIEKEEYQKALSYLKESLALKKQVHDEEGLSTTYNNMGYIYLYHHNNPDLAVTYFKLAEKHANEEELEKTYEYIATALEEQGNFYEAIVYFKKLNQIKEKLRSERYREELARIEARYSIEYAGL